jgi:hypothetical protein
MLKRELLIMPFWKREKPSDIKAPSKEEQGIHKPAPAIPLSDNSGLKRPDSIAPQPQRGRRTNLSIRDNITEVLQRRPMSRHELALAVDSKPLTIQRHLEWLERIRVIESFDVQGVKVWRLS